MRAIRGGANCSWQMLACKQFFKGEPLAVREPRAQRPMLLRRGAQAMAEQQQGPRDISTLLQEPSPHPSSTNSAYSSQGTNGNRFASSFVVYKKTGALKAIPLMPLWKQIPSGLWVVDREGCMLLEFSRPVQGDRREQSRNQKYDWERKQNFALSPLELATMIDDPTTLSRFFHDPNMKASKQGLVSKVFSCQPSEQGFYFGLLVKDNGEDTKFSVPVSKEEYKLFTTLATYLIPYLMGFDKIVKDESVS